MPHAVPWVQANLALILVIALIAYFVIRDGGPSVLRWFKRQIGYVRDGVSVAERKVAKLLPAVHSEIEEIKRRLEALEKSPAAPEPPAPPAA